MIEKFKSYARAAGVTGSSLVVVGIAALPLQVAAHEAQAEKPARVQNTAVSASVNQIVVRDADTGALRAATPAEAEALATQSRPSQLRRAAPATMLSRTRADGARGVRLTDESMSFSVMVRQPDGSMAEVCFDSREQAEAAVKASSLATKAATAPTE